MNGWFKLGSQINIKKYIYNLSLAGDLRILNNKAKKNRKIKLLKCDTKPL